ncbi:hypothetical protein CUN59_06275 [Cuspidothrix issatschenkoi CHARLIE-1]|uniref:Uncharacterized protein n=1 Tax=Cuspidothrix issatschenkoi CHARLIE-1 TaxID=2052836 RepID=A0A2S6CWR7_9CYAN|nr:hypothetical protein CUN59_06275 [Cuspidothrix issatschenkoi CHARLIE-1]
MYFGFNYPNIARKFNITIYNLDVLRILNRLDCPLNLPTLGDFEVNSSPELGVRGQFAKFDHLCVHRSAENGDFKASLLAGERFGEGFIYTLTTAVEKLIQV